MLSDIERRVLAHLPAWRDGDDAVAAREDEIAAGYRSIEAFSFADLQARLARDDYMPAASLQTEAELAEMLASSERFVPVALATTQQRVSPVALTRVLSSLEAAGLIDTASGDYRMTHDGLVALLAAPTVEPAPWSETQLRAAVALSERLVAAGLAPGSHTFNQAGGVTREGVKAWVAAHGELSGHDAATLVAAAHETVEEATE